MALLQALFALISKSAGKILNALFGWAVRALFGQTTAREQTFLSVMVAAAVAWPVLLVGIAAPKLAALLLAFVPIPHAVPAWTVRIVWMTLALLIPFGVGIAVAAKAPTKDSAKIPRRIPPPAAVSRASWLCCAVFPSRSGWPLPLWSCSCRSR